MPKNALLSALALALVLGIAACDSRDYEDEIAQLQEQLEAAKNQATEAVTENETLNDQIEALNEQLSDVEAIGEDALESARSGLNEAVARAESAMARLDEVGEQGAEQAADATTELRQDLAQLLERIQVAASDLGLDLEDDGTAPASDGGDTGSP